MGIYLLDTTNKTWKYSFDPITCRFLNFEEVTPFMLPSSVHTKDVAGGACAGIYTSCCDPFSLNYSPSTDCLAWMPYGTYVGGDGDGYQRKGERCLYCDSVSGWVEMGLASGWNGDDGPLGDIAESFTLVSLSTTNPTYANWGDGTITSVVTRSTAFASSFPLPAVNWEYKAELYFSPTQGGGWQGAGAYLVANGTLTIPSTTVTATALFSTTTFPVPLLVPEGHYSVKWRINVIDPGAYEIEECWWEHPVTLTATNPAPNPPIFFTMGIEDNGWYFKVKAYDTVRSAYHNFQPSGSAGQEFTPGFNSHCGTWEGICVEAFTGLNVTDQYTYPATCTAAGNTWTGFDQITSMNIVNLGSAGSLGTGYAGNSTAITQPNPLSGAPYIGGMGIDSSLWESQVIFPQVSGGSGNWMSQPVQSLWPADTIEVKVDWASGYTKTFTLTTPILRGRPEPSLIYMGWANGQTLPCRAEMWEIGNPLNEPGLQFTPYSTLAAYPNSNQMGGSYKTTFGRHLMLHELATMNLASSSNHDMFNLFYTIDYNKVELMPTQAPTYPYPVYEGVSNKWVNALISEGILFNTGVNTVARLSADLSLAQTGSVAQQAGFIIGGFTGEILYRHPVVLIQRAWADANSSLVPTLAGALSTAGTSNHYDNFITSIKLTTGGSGDNDHSSPALTGIGEVGTMTEALESKIFFQDVLTYAKDCPVCLPPELPPGCRYKKYQDSYIDPILGTVPGAHVDALNYDGPSGLIFSGDLNDPSEDGSCQICGPLDSAYPGKILTDVWPCNSSAPGPYYWLPSNNNPPPPACSVPGTGNILDNASGISSTSTFDLTSINLTDSSTYGVCNLTSGGIGGDWVTEATCCTNNYGVWTGSSCTMGGTCSIGSWTTAATCCTNNSGTWSGSACSGGAAVFSNVTSAFSTPTWYKMDESSATSSYQGYAEDSLAVGEINLRSTFWSQFIMHASASINPLAANFQARHEVYKYNTLTTTWDLIELRTTSTYFNGSPTVAFEKFDSTTSGTQMTYGHYKIRIRAVDTSVGWTGLEKISRCFQDIHFVFKVRVCDTQFTTEDGIVIADSNIRQVDPSFICSCCPAVYPTLVTGGTACSATQSIVANYSCPAAPSPTNSSISCELFFTDGCSSITTSMGLFPLIAGGPTVTSGTMSFGSNITTPQNICGGSYTIVSSYTPTVPPINDNDSCIDLTSSPLVVAPLSLCECMDATAFNYLTVYPNGNSDCNGVIGGTNTSCCDFPVVCSVPTAVIASTACGITLTISSSCPQTVLPDSLSLSIMDVSGTGNVWDATNPTFATAPYVAGTVNTINTWVLTENCTGATDISAFMSGSTGYFVLKQVNVYNSPSLTLTNVSTVFTIGTGSNPSGTTHYPVVCGCMNAAASNYSATATCDNGSCIIPGCMDGGPDEYGLGGFGTAGDGITATNYNAAATVDDGSCLYIPGCDMDTSLQMIWTRSNCNTGWCNPDIEFHWNQCDTDSLGNSIESPDSIEIQTYFSIDDAATWVPSTNTLTGVMLAPGNTSDTTTYFASTLTVQDMFNAWFAEGLLPSPDILDNFTFIYRIKTTYPTAPIHYSGYSRQLRILNPRGPNTYGWALNTLDNANFFAGVQTHCHSGIAHNTVYGIPPHASGSGNPVVMLIAPCGCTDDSTITPATGWIIPTGSSYASPTLSSGTALAADNVMVNPTTGIDDGSCVYSGCTDVTANNYDSAYTLDCISICGTAACCCAYDGCTNPCAMNYDPLATVDDGSCNVDLPAVTSGWWAFAGCVQEYRVTVQSSFNAIGLAWGFTTVDWVLIFDPGGANTPITTGTETVDLTTISNYVHWTYTDNCSVPTVWTSGPGMYSLTCTINYPAGASCDIILVHDFTISASHFVVCGCMNCPSCSNYDALVTCDDSSCLGCTDITAVNYDSGAVIDDGTCTYSGCTDITAGNYDFPADATHTDDGSCLHWHIWQKCGTSDRTSFGGYNSVGEVSLIFNQVGLTYINPTQTIGQTFQYTWWDGSAWIVDSCWEYIGTATGNNPEHYVNPLNTTNGPSQWLGVAVTTTYVDCTACVPVSGCMDPLALNYNALATIDDGSCLYPCCFIPTLAQAGGHVDDCDAEYVMNINCNTPSTNNADTITTVLEFWDSGGSVWVTANTDVHNPGGTDNITSHSVTYHYTCSADDFGAYGSGQYRIRSVITYSNGHTCTEVSTTETISLGTPGCLDATATNYTVGATCQCITCLFTHCCDTPVLTLDLTNGICDQSLEVNVSCTPPADDGYTALWQSFATGSWVTIQTDTSTAVTGSVTLTLPNSLIHTASGTSENYRVVFTSDYTAPTADCAVTSNILSVVAPILGCMDGGSTEYNVTTGTPGDGLPDGLAASNYAVTAECDDGSCCIDGCTDALASNFNWNTANSVDVTSLGHAAATCDDGGCLYTCCSPGTLIVDYTNLCAPFIEYTAPWGSTFDYSSCPTTPTNVQTTWTDPSGAVAFTNNYDPATWYEEQHMYASLLSYGDGVWTLDVIFTFSGSVPPFTVQLTVSVTLPIWGCTDATAVNYNAAATCDDGSCVFPVYGCTDPTALNYHPLATTDDGSCLYCGDGCTDSVSAVSNYDPLAICDCNLDWLGSGTCSLAGYYDETACTAVGACSVGTWVTEADCCTNNAGTWSGSSCSGGTATFTVATWTGNYTQAIGWDSCCLPCVYGCTDSAWNNYNSLATCPCTELLGSEPCDLTTSALTGDDCCCTSCIFGCTDGGSQTQAWWDGTNGALFDYATDTGYSVYPLAVPNSLGANNYNPTATCEDGSCEYNGCIDPTASNYNANLTGDCLGIIGGTNYTTCCIYPTTGCTDAAALNTPPTATVDDGSCMYCDGTTGNYEDAAGVDQAAWATGTTLTTPTSTDIAIDGTIFPSFSLTSVGLALQATAEMQTGNNNFAIELYSVPANGGASGTGTLVATSPFAPAASSTTIAFNFTGVAHGYYAIKLVIVNSVGANESEECFFEFSALVQATVCCDPASSNMTTIAAALRFCDISLCVYPGFCACTPAFTVLLGPPCTNTATINATLICTVATDITWSWTDAGGVILLSGSTLGVGASQIISSLSVISNGTYTFTYDETSTPYNTCLISTSTVSVSGIQTCGCTDPLASNYDGGATIDCNGDPIGTKGPGWNAPPCCLYCVLGCMSITAKNYNPLATCDDGSCIEPGDGCCDPLADNYNSAATNCIAELCEYCN